MPRAAMTPSTHQTTRWAKSARRVACSPSAFSGGATSLHLVQMPQAPPQASQRPICQSDGSGLRTYTPHISVATTPVKNAMGATRNPRHWRRPSHQPNNSPRVLSVSVTPTPANSRPSAAADGNEITPIQANANTSHPSRGRRRWTTRPMNGVSSNGS